MPSKKRSGGDGDADIDYDLDSDFRLCGLRGKCLVAILVLVVAAVATVGIMAFEGMFSPRASGGAADTAGATGAGAEGSVQEGALASTATGLDGQEQGQAPVGLGQGAAATEGQAAAEKEGDKDDDDEEENIFSHGAEVAPEWKEGP